MRTTLSVQGAKLFNVKPFGNGCRFGININSKKQEGGYTKGNFINCKVGFPLDGNKLHDLVGFLGDNEFNGKNTLEFIVQQAIEVGEAKQVAAKPQAQSKRQTPQEPTDDFVPF